MSEITKEQVEHVAKLARLQLTEAEKEAFAKDMGEILALATQLHALDDELQEKQVDPTSDVLSLTNVFRKDEVHESLPVQDVLKNTEEHQDGQVKVPRVLEG